MKRLPKVRSGLARLRVFRSTVRLGMTGSTVLSIVLWAMAAAFVLDFWIHMGRIERTIVLLGVIGVAIWAIVRYLAPALKVHESDTALAVMVDGVHGMHSDLVGALQFADEKRPQFGSEQLRDAVVDQTGQTAGNLDFLEGFSRKELFSRLLVFAVTLVIWLTPAVLYAEYTGAFLQRMAMFDARYPTRTNLKIVSPALANHRPAEGDSVTFIVHAEHISGPANLPETGTVRITIDDTGQETTVELKRQGGRSDVPAIYSGALASVLDNLTYTVEIDDDLSDLRRMTIVPRPRVKLDMEVIAPKYVRGKIPSRSKNQRQATVVEGSKVIPVITCENKKLDKGTITFIYEKDNSEKTTETFPLTRRGEALVFDQETGPLAAIVEMARFEINVTDTKGQHPESSIKGVVHIAADLPPRAALAGFSRFTVPGASPELIFQAEDDYALDKIILHLAVINVDGEQEAKDQPEPVVVAALKNKESECKGSYTLNLANMKLQKGYQVSAFIEAVDYRGELEGKSRRSEKWVFEITDKDGVLEAMDRLTEQMDKKLDEILRAQLEAGK